MKIDILCVGKIKESFFTDAIKEYSKRISKFATVNIVEVKDEKTIDGAGPKEDEMVLSKEASRLMEHLNERAFICGLCIEGKQLSSEELSLLFDEKKSQGYSHYQFIIGGSLGIYDELKKKCHFKLSFSKMTFPHQLMRVVLLEQIYRAFKISSNEPYHK